MTRVHHARSQCASNHSSQLDKPRAVAKKKKPYKIVLEAVTQEKKKLQSIVTYTDAPPQGFGFIPAGFPEFTEWCKEQCRQRNLDVHVVSAKPRNWMQTNPEKLSHHVHRIGHHFPDKIIALACSKFGYQYDKEQGLRKLEESTSWIAMQVENYSSRQQHRGRITSDQEDKEHIRGAVREMFSKIPENDLNSIVNHAFEAGTNRVGNATELSLARRVQLAVVAHIRHVYTDYDRMLKTGTWTEARQKVEHVSLAKLKEWRDEASEPSNEIEDTFREVIVLDDEESADEEDPSKAPEGRQQSMEAVSHRANARDLPPEKHTGHPRVHTHAMGPQHRRPIVTPHMTPTGVSTLIPSRMIPPRDCFADYARSIISGPGSHTSPQGEFHAAGHQGTRSPHEEPTANPPPIFLRKINGRIYQLRPIGDSRGLSRNQYDLVPPAATHSTQGKYVPHPPQSSFHRPPVYSRRGSEQDVILPSVESENISLASSRHAANGQRHLGERQVFAEHLTLAPFQSDRSLPLDPGMERLRPIHGRAQDEITHRAGQLQHGVVAPERDRQPMDIGWERRAGPLLINLTSSAQRPEVYRDGGQCPPHPAYFPTRPGGLLHAAEPSRRSPVRELRGPHHEIPAGELAHARMPNNGMFGARPELDRETFLVRDQRYA